MAITEKDGLMTFIDEDDNKYLMYPITRAELVTVSEEAAEVLGEAEPSVDDVIIKFGEHKNNTANPHGVTKAQVGLDKVDNTSDANKPISTATKQYVDTQLTEIEADINAIEADVGILDLGESSVTTLNADGSITETSASKTITTVSNADGSITETKTYSGGRVVTTIISSDSNGKIIKTVTTNG